MTLGLIGKKIGMTQKFFESGEAVPVTVLQVEPGKIVEVIDKEKRGYSALLVGYGHVKSSKLTKAMKGFFAKKSLEAKKFLKEYRIENTEQFKAGSDVTLDILKDKKYVDIRSKTIGKGFAGVMKRWNFGGLRATHGVSVSHRSHGSTGQRQDPGKVFKGKKMAGHMGDKFRTTQGLEIVEADLTNNLLYLRGSIPGSKNTYVEITEAIKHKNKISVQDRLKSYFEVLETAKTDKKDKKNLAKEAKETAKAEKEAAAPKTEAKKINMKLEEINIEGKKIGTHEVSDKVFSFKPRRDLIQLVINWQINNQRKKKGHTKSRGEVKGSRRKIVQQKGSGGARHGNITAPIFVGGGIAHGPRHRGQTRLTKLNKKVRNLGLISALSSKVMNNQVNVFDEPKLDNFKTKSFDNFLTKLETKSALIIHHDGASEKFLKSIKNVPNTKRLKVVGTNVYDLIKFQKVLFTKEALKTLQDRLTK